MSLIIIKMIWLASLQTLEMVFASTALAIIIGMPLAIYLVTTNTIKLYKATIFSRLIAIIIDAVRAIPFIILLVILIPVTRFIAGTSLGTHAAIIPLSIAAIPYFARIAELALAEVDPGLIDAVRAMGGTRFMIIHSVLIPETLPSLIGAITVTLVTLIGASAMAGTIGAGGLGDLAIRYGYQRFNTTIMILVVIVLIFMVCSFQVIGNVITKKIRR